jgi:hypothetical protein
VPVDSDHGAIFGDLPDRLRPYVRDGRIAVMPARRSVRLLLLDQVAQAFEPGRRYPEAVVSEILKSLYDDHATLRRYLVDEELMSRTADGTYWRSGGTVTPRVQDFGSLAPESPQESQSLNLNFRHFRHCL